MVSHPIDITTHVAIYLFVLALGRMANKIAMPIKSRCPTRGWDQTMELLLPEAGLKQDSDLGMRSTRAKRPPRPINTHQQCLHENPLVL